MRRSFVLFSFGLLVACGGSSSDKEDTSRAKNNIIQEKFIYTEDKNLDVKAIKASIGTVNELYGFMVYELKYALPGRQYCDVYWLGDLWHKRRLVSYLNRC